METGPDLLRAISSLLSPHGLTQRGGFNFAADDDPPPGPSGQPARSVLLVGNVGAVHWPHFSRWREAHADLSDPLDTWSAKIIGKVAEEFEARAVYPSDRPYLPFQQWAMRAEGLKPSPLGVLMHPHYGLWHAYRGALLFDREIAVRAPAAPDHLCDRCSEKPCLSACPVGAYSEAGFGYRSCLGHVGSAAGGACRTSGCLARNACPHGASHRYPAGVQAFHMASFIRGAEKDA